MAVGVVSFPFRFMRNLGKAQGYNGGMIGVPDPATAVQYPTSEIPVVGSVIAAKNSKGLDRAGHIAGAVSSAAFITAGGLSRVGYNPVVFSGKSVAPMTTAIVKYDPKFAEWQEIRLAKNIIRASKNWKDYGALTRLIDRSRIRSMTMEEIAIHKPNCKGFFNHKTGEILYKKSLKYSSEDLAATLVYEGTHKLDFLHFIKKNKISEFMENSAEWEYRAYGMQALFKRDILGINKFDVFERNALNLDPGVFIQEFAPRYGWKSPPSLIDFSDPIDAYIDFDYYGSAF